MRRRGFLSGLRSRLSFRQSTGRAEPLIGPIRGELLGPEHLAEHARLVARRQRIAKGTRRRWTAPLLARLDETRRILDSARRRLGAAADRSIDIGPAGEWLLDTFFVVQEHLQEVRDSVPRSYYRELPELASGALAGYPRVYEIAIELIAHTEGRLDPENVELFAREFQRVAPLTLGELWAVPAMLRLGLLENVRRMALRTVQRLDEVEEADRWAARLKETSELGNARADALDEFVRDHPPLTPVFVTRLLKEIRGAPSSFTPLAWLEQWIAEDAMDGEEAATHSHQRLALTQVMMANSITSLRALSRMDWSAFVERQSAVEATLRTDPTGYYARMTFGTRDQYRHVVERVAKRTGRHEAEVARSAVALAEQAAREHPGDVHRAHVGYYLVDDGRRVLEREAGYRSAPGERLHRYATRHPTVIYFGGLVLGTASVLVAVLAVLKPGTQLGLVLAVLLALIPATEVAVSAVNQLVTWLMPPRVLPKLQFREGGIPAEFRTAVVVPTLLPSVKSVREALEHLEVQFLANRDPHLHFALLSDFADASTETQQSDAGVVEAASAGIRALNAKYAGGAQDAFYLLHRPRRWNPRQGPNGVWMGWERKRGKLAEFNRFLRGRSPSAFNVVVGDVSVLRRVRYVITLDADTVLPPDSARLLVGAIAHPLNRAVQAHRRGWIVRGYGVLQPRVGISLPGAYRSRFAAIHSGHPGVDPYTTAVSDVYQDLFGEGSFTGKGIYDVDAFEWATHGRFPENTLLSHDLIEGNYARAALVTDIELYDDYPTHYLTYTRRKHRWIRGDWQLLRWLTPWVPGPSGIESNRLSALSRWKIFDNLRRSLVEPTQLILLAAGWAALPGAWLGWTALVLGMLAFPWLFALLLAAVRPPLDKSWRAYYAAVWRDARTSAHQVALAAIFLPHQAWVSIDAIVRTLWRFAVSRRNLLEWQTASQAERLASSAAGDVWRNMWMTVALAGVLGALVVYRAVSEGRQDFAGGGAIAAARWAINVVESIGPLVLVALWAVSPAIAYRLSAPAVRRELRLPATERAAALRYALLHWRYFDRFVNAETKWLVPDNFQEEPAPVVSLRTSPTNIGLQLLATVSAYDLGFLTIEATTERLEHAFRTLERMPRFRGHFYNWYDLSDLRVLNPPYISTVDSGNLAGHMLALRQACLAIADEPAFHRHRLRQALDTALALVQERLQARTARARGADSTQRRAAARAAAEVLAGRNALGEAPAETDPLHLLAIVRATLEAVRGAFDENPVWKGADGNGDADADSASAWIDWTLSLVSAHQRALDALRVHGVAPGARGAYAPTLRELAASSTAASELVARLQSVAWRAHECVKEMDFGFLFDDTRKLFAIGYAQSTHALDGSYYDLLASESRLASFVAIAKDDVPVEHWFRLGRGLTSDGSGTALVSWSGSMFEYLMPLLIMQTFPFTLLDHTCGGAVRRHIAYGAERGVPWGLSESAYNVRDPEHTYQYRAFGVPDLALKRGLSRDIVVAPYASALAALVDPRAALANLRALERTGALGPYGFRDALDFTRPQPGRRYAVVRSYMAHHIGMSLVALTNALTGYVWQRRFHIEPMVRSAELLLHERIPRRLVLQAAQPADAAVAMPEPEPEQPVVREFDTPDTPRPSVALLGNLPYTIMVSNAGSGYSRYEALAVTRWRADGTRDNTGQFCYVKDLTTGRVWSATHQPVCAPAGRHQILLATDRVTFVREDGEVETRTEIAVVPEDAAEVRRVTVTNDGRDLRELELTSYGEIVLGPPDADRAHPAFSKLFVETEYHAWCTGITATRRPRSAGEQPLWCVHVVDSGPERVGPVTCETDRARFLGRGRSTRDPLAMERDGALSGTTGAVLDPIFALRTRVRLEPGASATVAFATLVATSRERAFELADRYHDPHAAQRALDLGWTHTQAELGELSITPTDAAVYQELAGRLFYPDPALRPPERELRESRGGQPQLWAIGISGDWPILLATIDSPEGLPTLRQLLSAHHYWRRKGITVDLVVLNTRPSTYLQELQDQITATTLGSSEAGVVDQPGGVFLRHRDSLRNEELGVLRATARVHVTCDGLGLGRLLASADQSPDESTASAASAADSSAWPARVGAHDGSVSKRGSVFSSLRLPKPISVLIGSSRAGVSTSAIDVTRGSRKSAAPPGSAGAPAPSLRDSLVLDNGFGGLTSRGEYEIRLVGDVTTPAPWANVIANPFGGFLITESGAGFAWVDSSYFFRLTPWHNDPVSDPPGEALYLRDAATGELWTPTPRPIRNRSPYIVRHGPARSTFEHQHSGIATTLTMGMAEDSPVKITVLRVTNRGAAPRHLTATSYVEWTLGVQREHTQHHVCTAFDRESGGVFAQNAFDPQFAGLVAFSWVSERVTSFTADRREFLGRNGDVGDPAALRRSALEESAGAGMDPCAALQFTLVLAPGETRDVVLLLGAAAGEAEAREAIGRYGDVAGAWSALDRAAAAWERRLSVIAVRTPEPSFDAMANSWALYQALSCRMWGRSGLYQSSGAYGFRDQLQDAMAFVYAEPTVAREHILRAAARQFVEGDVQHWWHPQSGRGVRTRFSDDLAWLPYVVDHYVRVTGDRTVLEEVVPFLIMRGLEPHEHELYDLPSTAEEQGTVYEHCVRALRRACTAGAHGLPRIGIGDWNDGLNRVGVEGRGESVWLAWFLIATLRAFAEHAAARNDAATAAEFRARADGYVEAVERAGWDGAWYRRAYFDDGTPLGSAESDECKIDSLAQSWSVISGAADPARQEQAMRSLYQHLVREDARLIMLLTPPFDKTPHDPGYIKGYLPGVRENGGQYTHAGLWVVLATLLRGDGDRAFALFQMLNPLTHARTPAEAETYKVEPYVVAADVYTAPGHVGRGGWTWYTGSASWMYRVAVEAILGFEKHGDRLAIDPCIPRAWPEFSIEYRYGRSTYAITVRNPHGVNRGVREVMIDGTLVHGGVIPLADDGVRREVVVWLGHTR